MNGLSGWGRAGLALLLIHVSLLFFPPIPPDIKGSLWSYLAAYTTIVLWLVETGRGRERLLSWWGRRSDPGRWALGLGIAVGVLALGTALRWLATPLYVRFSQEEGLWEPATLFCYLAAGVLLAGVARRYSGREARHWRFLAGGYVVLGLEEIDYFGIFGGLIGRIDGVYVGSLHDLIMLAAEGHLSLLAWALIGGAALVALVGLILGGYVQPRRLLELLRSRDFFWVSVALGFLLAAAAVEAELFAWTAGALMLEELLELPGGICFLCYALSLAAPAGQPSEPIIRAPSG